MIFGADGKALVGRIKAGAARHGPAFKDAVDFQPEIIVQSGGVMFLDDEAVPAPALPFSGRFLRPGEVALAIIFLQGVGFGHISGPLASGSLGSRAPPGRRFLCRRLCRRAFRAAIDRFLERGHQVDHIAAAIGRRFVLILDDAATLGLLLLVNKPFERIDIAVVKAVRLERRRLLFDERLGQVEHRLFHGNRIGPC